MILSTDLISWLADQQLIFQINAWLARAEVLSIDLSNKYLTGPSQISVLWSFRYVMPKYCRAIFQIITWLFWAKILSAYLYLWPILYWWDTLFATDFLLATYFIEEAEVLSDFSSCFYNNIFNDVFLKVTFASF